jgi:hypothetical protein
MIVCLFQCCFVLCLTFFTTTSGLSPYQSYPSTTLSCISIAIYLSSGSFLCLCGVYLQALGVQVASRFLISPCLLYSAMRNLLTKVSAAGGVRNIAKLFSRTLQRQTQGASQRHSSSSPLTSTNTPEYPVFSKSQSIIATPRTLLTLPLAKRLANDAGQSVRWSLRAQERLQHDLESCVPFLKYERLKEITEHHCARVMDLCQLDKAIIL